MEAIVIGQNLIFRNETELKIWFSETKNCCIKPKTVCIAKTETATLLPNHTVAAPDILCQKSLRII